MIFVRYCIKCKQDYDIGINYDICPECRKKDCKEEDIDKNEKWL